MSKTAQHYRYKRVWKHVQNKHSKHMLFYTSVTPPPYSEHQNINKTYKQNNINKHKQQNKNIQTQTNTNQTTHNTQTKTTQSTTRIKNATHVGVFINMSNNYTTHIGVFGTISKTPQYMYVILHICYTSSLLSAPKRK